MNSLNQTKTDPTGHLKAPLWRLTMAGKLRADGPDDHEIRFQLGKTATLLGFLTYFCRESHSREMLADRFWPKSPPLEARHCLRQALTFLRHQLEPGDIPSGTVIQSSRQQVQINPDAVTTDVFEFRDRVERATQIQDRKKRADLLIQSVEEYNGQFLPGQFEEWVLVERERVASEYTHALGLIAADLTALGENDRAISYAQRATSIMPLNEQAHRDLMRLYSISGRAAEAMQHYDRLKRYLKRELGSKPQPITRALARSINTRRDLPNSNEIFVSAFTGVTEVAVPIDRPYTPRRRRKSKSWTKAFPVKQTLFFGREKELTRLQELLTPGRNAPRIVTVHGPNGSGKTRLVLEALPKLQDTFNGSVTYVALDTVTLASDLIPVLMDHLNLSDASGEEPHRQISKALSQKPTLLILDNCDHLITPVREFITSLLKEAPKLTFLTTSQQLLGMDKEVEFPLMPLAVPQGPARPIRLMEFPSIRLFVDRAQTVCPEFQITLRNSPSISAVCARLEGIPLAIELAAARARAFAPPKMLTALNDRFDFLLSRHHNVDLRHRTLRAAIEWSYEQLPPPLQYLFNALSVFRGSWTLDAAQAVCAVPGSGHREPKGSTEPGEVLLLATQVLDLLEQLQERSLVAVDSDEGETRFRMLETLREFGQAQMAQSLRKKLIESHAAYYLRIAEQAYPHLFEADRIKQQNRLILEADNFRVALHSTLSPTMRLGLAGSLWRIWQVKGDYKVGIAWLQRGLEEAPRADASLRARAQLGLGVLLHLQGSHAEARHALESSMALYRHISDIPNLGRALSSLEVVAAAQGDKEAAKQFAEQIGQIGQGKGDAPSGYSLFDPASHSAGSVLASV